MGIFSEFLTKLNKGDQVRITQTNGQIMEGVNYSDKRTDNGRSGDGE